MSGECKLVRLNVSKEIECKQNEARINRGGTGYVQIERE